MFAALDRGLRHKAQRLKFVFLVFNGIVWHAKKSLWPRGYFTSALSMHLA